MNSILLKKKQYIFFAICVMFHAQNTLFRDYITKRQVYIPVLCKTAFLLIDKQETK